MDNKTLLISIHPEYASKIISGEKRVEFRRSWAPHEIQNVVVYSTSPVCRIVALASVSAIMRAAPSKIWDTYKDKKPGITRRKLLDYFSGKAAVVAIEFSNAEEFKSPLLLSKILGTSARAPQSYQYLDSKTLSRIKRYKRASTWK